jgi:DNA-binding CsgD family transcriptional regulator
MAPAPSEPHLSPKEIQILALLAQGKTSEAIAAELSIAKNTVDTHRRRIILKMRCRNTREAVHQALLAGWIGMG